MPMLRRWLTPCVCWQTQVKLDGCNLAAADYFSIAVVLKDNQSVTLLRYTLSVALLLWAQDVCSLCQSDCINSPMQRC